MSETVEAYSLGPLGEKDEIAHETTRKVDLLSVVKQNRSTFGHTFLGACYLYILLRILLVILLI